MRNFLAVSLLIAAGAAGGYAFAIWKQAQRPSPPSIDLAIRDSGIYRVRKVVDGDTIVLENGLHIRYHGVNAPEMGRFVKDISPMAAEATARNIELVEGKRIRVQLASSALDIHGRIIARVLLTPEDSPTGAELDVEKVLVKEGLAKIMGIGTPPEEYAEFKNLQEEARAAKVGLWGIEQTPAAEGAPYCAANGSRIYHLSTCSLAQKIKAANRHEYASVAEAEAAGLAPCSKCVKKE